MLPRPLALALAAGASNAAAQVGMLRALAERGITPDFVVGSSAGAINAAVVASSGTIDIDRLEAMWSKMDRGHFLADRRWKRIGNALQRQYLFTRSGLLDLLERNHGPDRLIEELPIELVVVASNLTTGYPEVIDAGSLYHALATTCAVPGYIEPGRNEKGDLLVDGYLTARLPVVQAVEHGAQSIIALDTPSKVRTPMTGNVREVLRASFDTVMQSQTRLAIAHASSTCRVVHITLGDREASRGFDFSRSGELIRAGYLAAGDALRVLDRQPD